MLDIYDVEPNWDLFEDDCVNRKWGNPSCMKCSNLYFCHEHPDDRLDKETGHWYNIYPFSQRESTIKEGVEYVPFEITRHNRHLIGYGENYKTKNKKYYDSCAEWEQIIPDTFEYNGVNYLIKAIGDDGFYHCDELRVVSTPHSVESIAFHSFNDCFDLEAIYIGKGTKIINARFIECFNLIKIKVHEDNPYFCDVNGVLFSKDMKILIRYPAGRKEEEYEIPEGVEEVASYAFYGCPFLKRIKGSKTLKKIGESCFRCSKKLEYVLLNICLEKIETNVVLGCDKLQEVYYQGSKAQWESIEKDNKFDEIVLDKKVKIFCLGG